MFFVRGQFIFDAGATIAGNDVKAAACRMVNSGGRCCRPPQALTIREQQQGMRVTWIIPDLTAHSNNKVRSIGRQPEEPGRRWLMPYRPDGINDVQLVG